MELKVESVREVIDKKEGGEVEKSFIAKCLSNDETATVNIRTE